MFSTTAYCAMAYIFGVLVSSNVSLTILLLFLACTLLVYLIRSAISTNFQPLVPLIILFISFGAVRCYQASTNRLYYELPNKYVTAYGTVCSTPSHSVGRNKYRYTMRAEKIDYLENTYKVNSKILINTNEKLEFGDEIQINGFLNEISGRENEYEYDYSKYYKSLGIYNRITASNLTKTGERHFISPSHLAGKLKNHLYNSIMSNFKEDDAAVLCAVLLNDKSYFDTDYRTSLTRTGIMHTLYSPYVHIAILFMIAGLLRRKGSFASNTAAFFLLIFYSVFNTGSVTVVKTALAAALILMLNISRGESNRMNSLCTVLLLMVVFDPLLCYNSGFMYSVICTAYIYFFYPIIYVKFSSKLGKRKKNTKHIARILSLWLIFCIGTLPFSAYYFNGVSAYGILFTPLMAPLTVIIYIISPFMLLFSGQNELLSFSLNVIKHIPSIIEKLPFHYVMLRTPTILEIIICFLIWLLFILSVEKKLKTQKAAYIATILIAFVICGISDISPNTLDIYFVNVGQGDGAVLHTGKGETVLIDGGGSADYQTGYNIGERIYLPYLISHGFTKIDTAIVSHYHKDHVEGIIAACKNLRVNTLIMPDTAPDNMYRQQLEDIATERGIKIEYLMQSDEIRFRSGLTLKVLAPDSGQLRGDDENDTSLVINAEFGEFNALFTGDSSDDADNSYPSDIDILKVPHHGSLSASSEDYVQSLKPDYAVISVGKDNTYNLPRRSIIERYKAVGSQIMRTDELGDIRFKVHKNGDIKYSSLKYN